MSEQALLTAARHVLHAWDTDSNMEKNDLSDELWAAMNELRHAATVVHEVVPK
jgi:hypothetical protein